MRLLLPRAWLKALGVLGAAVLAWLASLALREPRLLLVALDAEEAMGLCAQAGVPLADFWERAEAVGVRGVILREKPLAHFLSRGEILSFGREEIEKWRAVGLIAPGFPLRPEVLWARDPQALSRIMEAASRQGVRVSTSSLAGYLLAELDRPLSPAAPAGYAPELLGSLGGRRLISIPWNLEGQEGLVGLRWEGGALLAGGGPHDLLLQARTLPAQAPAASWLRAAYGHPRRLLVARAGPEGLEGLFEALRRSLRLLSSRGAPFSPPEGASLPAWPRLGRLLLWALGILGPLLAARAGLFAFKQARALVLARLPPASPALQLAAGLLATAGASFLLGLAARGASLLVPGAEGGWALGALLGPLFLGLLTLYTIDPQAWLQGLKKPLTPWNCLCGLAFGGAALLLIAPRALTGGLGLLAAPEGVLGPWWASWRWREMLIGYPCLLHAFFLINRRMDPEAPPASGDPRGFFLLGLLAPIGLVTLLGRRGLPAELALAQTALALLVGALLGSVFLALRLLPGSKGLRWVGTLVPRRQV